MDKMQVSVIQTLFSPPQRLHVRILIKIVIIKENSKHRWMIRIRKRQEPLFFFSFPFRSSSMHLTFPHSPTSLQHEEACAEGHVAATRKSHRCCLTLTSNNTKTIERMTCHCFCYQLGETLQAATIILCADNKRNCM